MNNKVLIGGGVAVLGIVAWYMLTQGTQGGQEVEYRYAPVEEGELVLSRSSTGVLVPLTTVDVKSKAGGTVVRLAVEEGTIVAENDLVAVIDPRDTRASYEQAQADADAANARVDQARTSATLTERNTETAVRDAELRVRQAEIALARAREQFRTQPELTNAAIRSAEANLKTQQEALTQLQRVSVPQRQRDAETAVASAKTALDNALANLARQKELYELGFGAKAPVESAETAVESARATHASALQRLQTLDTDVQADLRAQQARVDQAQAQLRQAQTNASQITLSEQDVTAAQRSLDLARVALKKSQDDRLNVQNSRTEIRSAQASAVRSRVSAQNALEQLESTNVVAPRSGVVTLKYLEEGTIIPPGTSVFSEGTSIVQIADVTRMFVECNVDEADIAAVRVDQDVRILVEAYPGKYFPGKVRKVFPAAESANNLTSVRVRIEILELDQIDQSQTPLRPGMNVDCEFIEFVEKEALLLPQQALKTEEGKTYVLVKTADEKKPERREVTVGRTGNEKIEILSGLQAGEEVVVAEINLSELRDRLQRIEQAQQGGGLTAGGGQRR